MQLEPYLFFEGRCQEAIDFYRQAIGAQIDPGWQLLAGHIVFLAILAVRPQGLFPKVSG